MVPWNFANERPSYRAVQGRPEFFLTPSRDRRSNFQNSRMSNRRWLAASIKLRGAFPCFPHGRNCSWNSCSILTVLKSENGCKLSFTQSSAGIENPNLSPRKNAPLLISPWIRWQGGRSKAVRDATQQLKLGQDGRKGRTTARRSSRMRPGRRVGWSRRAREGWGSIFFYL